MQANSFTTIKFLTDFVCSTDQEIQKLHCPRLSRLKGLANGLVPINTHFKNISILHKSVLSYERFIKFTLLLAFFRVFYFFIQASLVPPLFFPLRPYANQGFTAVVLCYDRVDTMFKVITKIADTPSLTKVS